MSTALKKIKLELARTAEAPAGRSDDGFVIIAPLDADGRLDPEAWHTNPSACRVTRFHGSAAHRLGELCYEPAHGASLPRWWAEFDDGGRADGFRFETEHFVPGEYISIAEDNDAQTRPYRVVSVLPADQPTPHKTHL